MRIRILIYHLKYNKFSLVDGLDSTNSIFPLKENVLVKFLFFLLLYNGIGQINNLKNYAYEDISKVMHNLKDYLSSALGPRPE